MKVAVCDDELLICQQICDMACQMPEVESCCCYVDGEELFKNITAGVAYDVIIMDIQWDGKERGIDWSAQLQKSLPETRIIFVTGYTKDYVQQIFLSPSNLSGFLMKPVDENLLHENLLKVKKNKLKRDNKKFIFQQKGSWCTLYYDEIEFLESAGHKIYVSAQPGTFECYRKLEQVANEFPCSFLHCHKSYLVNLNKVRQFGTKRKLIMESGKEIPVSKTRYAAVRERYFEYIRKNGMEDYE